MLYFDTHAKFLWAATVVSARRLHRAATVVSARRLHRAATVVKGLIYIVMCSNTTGPYTEHMPSPSLQSLSHLLNRTVIFDKFKIFMGFFLLLNYVQKKYNNTSNIIMPLYKKGSNTVVLMYL